MINQKISKPEKKEVKISSKTQKLKFMQKSKPESKVEEPEPDSEEALSPSRATAQTEDTNEPAGPYNKAKMWSLAQGIDSFYKRRETTDTMNLYKNVKFMPNSKAVYLGDDGKEVTDTKKSQPSHIGRRSFKKTDG